MSQELYREWNKAQYWIGRRKAVLQRTKAKSSKRRLKKSLRNWEQELNKIRLTLILHNMEIPEDY